MPTDPTPDSIPEPTGLTIPKPTEPGEPKPPPDFPEIPNPQPPETLFPAQPDPLPGGGLPFGTGLSRARPPRVCHRPEHNEIRMQVQIYVDKNGW